VLVDHGANVNARQRNHWTPIHFSAVYGYLEITELLIERGADVHAMNDDGSTPYELSLEAGYPKIADLLRERVAVRPRYELTLLLLEGDI
jgi:ankyrin repeat protein